MKTYLLLHYYLVLSSAWITNYMGLSLGFGAFIAGVMIAETEFQHKIKSTINPFKGLFLGFFHHRNWHAFRLNFN